jgi:hypothetical protein
MRRFAWVAHSLPAGVRARRVLVSAFRRNEFLLQLQAKRKCREGEDAIADTPEGPTPAGRLCATRAN